MDRSVEKRVIEIVSGLTGAPRHTISKNARLKDLCACELDAVELILQIEDEFGLSIPDKDADALRTVGQVIGYIQRHMG